MNYSRFSLLFLASVVCLAVSVADVDAQGRSRSAPRGGSTGRAVQRGGPVRGSRPAGPRVASPRVNSRVVVVSPRGYRPYYNPYRSRIRVGIYAGFGYPYYGYPYRYGYAYPAYGYPYYGSYPYSYGGYGGGYGYGTSGYAYGGVRIQNAPRDAQVFVDGYYAGIVDDFDGPFQRLELEAGAHQIEIRGPGLPPLQYDVNVQPGQTLNIHVR